MKGSVISGTERSEEFNGDTSIFTEESEVVTAVIGTG